ncbi:hypothetical protein OU571_23220, partial [Escherichia coli]|nr:hypothetical protein [Escherichia coli]
ADRNRSHWSTSKTPSYTKSVSWHHHRRSGSSGIKSNRWPGDVIPDDNDCGWYVRFSSVTKENIMTFLFTPLHLWRRMIPVL